VSVFRLRRRKVAQATCRVIRSLGRPDRRGLPAGTLKWRPALGRPTASGSAGVSVHDSARRRGSCAWIYAGSGHFAVALQRLKPSSEVSRSLAKADHPAAAWPVHPDDLHGQRRIEFWLRVAGSEPVWKVWPRASRHSQTRDRARRSSKLRTARAGLSSGLENAGVVNHQQDRRSQLRLQISRPAGDGPSQHSRSREACRVLHRRWACRDSGRSKS